MQDQSTKLINTCVMILGLLSSWPFFCIPDSSLIYVNRILDVAVDYAVHPSYTYSLGPALPICLVGLASMYMLCFVRREFPYSKSDNVLYMIFPTFLYILIASESIKSLAFGASLISIYLIFKLSESKIGYLFLKSFLCGLILFTMVHAFSLVFYGFAFSRKTEGISIFSIEIYQALVSYAAVIAVLFGTLILRPRLLYFENLNIGVDINKIIYLLTLMSLLTILFFLQRRAGFILIIFALSIAIFIWFRNTKFKKISILIAIIFISIIYYFSEKYYFYGVKSLNWENMIAPRLMLYQSTLEAIYNSDFYQIMFGVKNGWAAKHNTYFDILFHSGLFGVSLIGLSFWYLGRLYISRFSVDVTRPDVIFLITAVLFDNFVNTIFSTPYYSVCIFIIFTLCLRENDHKAMLEEF